MHETDAIDRESGALGAAGECIRVEVPAMDHTMKERRKVVGKKLHEDVAPVGRGDQQSAAGGEKRPDVRQEIARAAHMLDDLETRCKIDLAAELGDGIGGVGKDRIAPLGQRVAIDGAGLDGELAIG